MISARSLLPFSISLGLVATLSAQTARINPNFDDSRMLRVSRTTHPLTRVRSEGRVPATQPMARMLLLLNSSSEQQAALDNLTRSQQDPASPDYHKWLTPEEFGQRFGASDADIETLSSWLRGKGFVLNSLPAGKRSIEFSGTVELVERAFRTEMHHYLVEGKRHTANAIDISLPEAFAGVVGGIASLNDFRSAPLSHVNTTVRFSEAGHVLSPGDFGTIYNVAPLWRQGVDGTGQTIAIVGRTNLRMSDVRSFRATFGLAANDPQVVLNGPDPGILSDAEETEALLDVEWAGAVAPGATIKFVASADTAVAGGDLLSAQYIVNNNLASVLSTSFGMCEQYLGDSNAFYRALWQQAAAQGISVIAAAGDSGSAGCDSAAAAQPASGGLAVSGIASTPYNLAVGGTQFSEGYAVGAFWGPLSNAANNYTSALSYIPEVAWNESAWAVGGAANNLHAGGGGISTLYRTPDWQSARNVPAADPGTFDQHHRYLPDISLSGAGHDSYLVMKDGALIAVSGTSAGAPAFSGIMALRNQARNSSEGNPGPDLYSMYSSSRFAFHDIVSGSNSVPCVSGSPGCTPTYWATGTMAGWDAGSGYDLATGLGSVDALNLVTDWPAGIAAAPVISSLNPNPMTGSLSDQVLTVNGSNFQIGAVVTLSSATSSTVYQGINAAFVSAGQLRVVVNVGETPAVWNVQVTNPKGSYSNTATLTVSQKTSAPPVIRSLSPATVTASASPVSITLTGTGFQPNGSAVVLGYPGYSVTLPAWGVTSTSTQIRFSADVGTTPRTWTVQVINIDGQSSAAASFTVTAPRSSLNISGITALTPGLSDFPALLTITGAGFQSGMQLLFTAPGVGRVVATSIVSLSPTSVQAVAALGSATRTWTVQAVSPGGATSNQSTLQIN